MIPTPCTLNYTRQISHRSGGTLTNLSLVDLAENCHQVPTRH